MKKRMHFDIKGRAYFLQFVSDEGRWLLFRPGPRGVKRIAIADDTALPLPGGVIIPFEEQSTHLLN